MKQIYETESHRKDQLLLGETSKMYHDGKTPEEISLAIKQPIDRVLEGIELCKKADRIRNKNK